MSSPQDSADRERSESVRQFYQLTAWVYNPVRSWWSKRTLAAESELDALFAKNVQSDSRILELGPGTGVNLARLYRVSPEFKSYVGIDLSREMLSRVRKVAGGDPAVELRLGDVCELSSVEGSFDFVVSTWILSHLERPEAIVRAALTKLAPGGAAVFLFLSAPRRGAGHAIYKAIWSVSSVRLVDPEPLHRLPGLERADTFDAALGAMATLMVYRAAQPPHGEETSRAETTF